MRSSNKKQWKADHKERQRMEADRQRRIADLENGVGPGVSMQDAHRGPSGELLI